MERNVVAKKVFQLHWVEIDTGCIEHLQLKRARMRGSLLHGSD